MAGFRALSPRPLRRGTPGTGVPCALLLAAGGGAHAETLDTTALHWNAFATLGAVYQNSRGLAFRRHSGQGRGARAGELDGDCETRLAVVRLSALSATPFVPLAAGLAATGVAQAVMLAGSLLHTPQTTYAADAGTHYTGSHLRATAMLVRFDSHDPVGPNENTGYVLLGWWVRNVTPFVVFSVSENFGQAQPTGLPAPPVFAPLIAGAEQAQTSFQTPQRDLSLGARYDFAPHMDCKVQHEQVWRAHSALIFDTNIHPPNAIQ